MFQIRKKSDGKLFCGTASKPKFDATSATMFHPTGIRSFMGHVKKYHPNGSLSCADGASVPVEDLEVVKIQIKRSDPQPLEEFIQGLK